jgi:outer membrane protein TolC
MDEPLPADLQSAHATIRHLRQQLAQARRLLVSLMGYDPTDAQAVLGYQQSFREAMARAEAIAHAEAMAHTPPKRTPKKK